MRFIRNTIYLIVIFFAAFSAAWAQIPNQEFDDDYDLAWDYYNIGQINKAIELFRQMQVKYPGNSKLYLTLGTIFLEQGDYATAKDELRNALLNKPDSDIKVWANIRLGEILLKDGALDAAERHFRAGAMKGADPKALIEGARGLHRIQVQHFLEGRYTSGRYLVHYFPFGGIQQDDIAWLIERIDGSLQLCNNILKVKREFPVDIYLYPNAQAFVNFFGEGGKTVYPEYNEIHEILDKDYDYIEAVYPLLLYHLQSELNRHGSTDFIASAIPYLVRGEVQGIDIQTYIYALIQHGLFVDLKILRHPSFYPMVDKAISGPEVASLITFLQNEHRSVDIRQFLTQPNLEALYHLDVITAQQAWVEWVKQKQKLTDVDEGRINSIFAFVKKFELTGYIPDDAMESFRKGLELVGAGKVKEGETEIKRIADAYPDFGLANYALGRMELERGGLHESRVYFERAVETLTSRGSSWGWAHYNLGYICESDEDYLDAKMHYELTAESDVPDELRALARGRISGLQKVIDIAPTRGAAFDQDDFRDTVTLFSFIDLGLLNNKTDEMEPYFATELNAASFTQFDASYREMMAPFTAPLVMHQVVGAQTAGDFVKVKVILKLEVPKEETRGITQFDRYLELRRGIVRYFLLLRNEKGLRIVDFIDAPLPTGKARVLEEGGTVIPFESKS